MDTSIECGPRLCLNFAEFIWNNQGILFLKCTPRLLYLSKPTNCIYNIVELLATVGYSISSGNTVSMNLKRNSCPFVDNCSYVRSGKCCACLRHPPTLNVSASYTVFQPTLMRVTFSFNKCLIETLKF